MTNKTQKQINKQQFDNSPETDDEERESQRERVQSLRVGRRKGNFNTATARVVKNIEVR